MVDIKARGDGNDPPDCEIITADGFRIAVEVTELVDESAAKLRDKLEKASPKKRGVWYSPQTIRNWIRQGALPRNWAEWDKRKIIDGLTCRVQSKDNADNVKGGPYSRYILLIHCAEYLLTEELMRSACEEVTGMPTKLIDDVYVILAYKNYPNKDYPIFRLSVKRRDSGFCAVAGG